ncbi:aminotransferase class I/II-fold pyridoxal phosphate-dependent enzyme [Guptibacillus algicola]|uniref:methionine gamma-lyase family protein n=1 Tax=Guptibacillus algicola TaxID=225844 RepID=UPI001CD62784|nr:methionine gamma-lyase family protein [Alkalihalobacillus algicola]MCA0988134.1 aminotransferase class I/II-fold pyridoxal phosphate-dependent enzyme [Alkalihalobacillus algicola]
MFNHFTHQEQLKQLSNEAEDRIQPMIKEIDQRVESNQYRVLEAFHNNKISDYHFTPSTGYGYDDDGRDTLEKLYGDVFGGEAGLVRPQIVSGTHAISTALFGVLRPQDELLYITGAPYDTLEEIVGTRGEGNGSLKDFHIGYKAIPLSGDQVDYEAVKEAITDKTKMIGIQRSKGYANRPSFTIDEIREMISFVKSIKEDVIVFVDNCYGEFVEEREPCHVGADLIAGSLIKNPGAGIVKTGGYLVGREDLIELCGYRLTSPGIGREVGASLYSLQEMYQGLFLAPHTVGQAVKGAVYSSALLESAGFNTTPSWNSKRTDLIQSVQFNDRERMVSFCQAIQAASPVNAHVRPEPAYMPGYEDDVIMAAGTFIQGASLELSADGPLRPPYVAYVQGGLTYEHVKISVLRAVDDLLTKGLVSNS